LIEQVMFFVLGLLTAGLVALMVTPAIWRRAARLTRQRIERSVPMTLAEIQADKDQLRAEFAMSTRRLELTVERLKEKAAEQLLEINEQRETITRLSSEHGGKVEAVRALDQREAELRERLREREEALAIAEADIKAADRRLTDRTKAYQELEAAHEAARAEGAETSSELQARTAEIAELRTVREQLLAREEALHEERKRAERLQAQIARMESDRADRVQMLEFRDAELDRLRAELNALTAARHDSEKKAGEIEAARIEAESQIARLTLRLEQEAAKTPGDDVRKAIADLEADKQELDNRLAALADEREALKAENAELRRMSGDDWEAERMENALMRERINDIATSIAKVTRTLGSTDPADTSEAASPVRLARSRPETPAAEPPRENGQKTLSDRIHALQRSASSGG
jgi:chromosome segregation ATPase